MFEWLIFACFVSWTPRSEIAVLTVAECLITFAVDFGCCSGAPLSVAMMGDRLISVIDSDMTFLLPRPVTDSCKMQCTVDAIQ